MISENEKGAIASNNNAPKVKASSQSIGTNGRDRNLIPDNGETCDCAESKYKNKLGEIVPTGLHAHCCEYVKLKNSLIPAAEAFADRAVATDSKDRRWARFFGSRARQIDAQDKGARRCAMTAKITSAKRVISRMDIQELQIIRKYLSDREKVIWDREKQAKITLQWEKIAALPVGSAVMVNTQGGRAIPPRHKVRDHILQRAWT